MLQEAAQEFVAVEARTAPAVGGAVLVPDGDARLVEGNDAALGYGDAKHVAREVGEHGLGVVAPGLAIYHPWLPPHRLGHNETRPALAQRGAHLGAHQDRQRPRWHQKIAAA